MAKEVGPPCASVLEMFIQRMEILRWVWFSGLFFVPHKVSIRPSPQTGAGQEAAGGGALISPQQSSAITLVRTERPSRDHAGGSTGGWWRAYWLLLDSKDLYSRSASSIKCHRVLDKSLDLSELQIPHLCVRESGLHLHPKVVWEVI